LVSYLYDNLLQIRILVQSNSRKKETQDLAGRGGLKKVESERKKS